MFNLSTLSKPLFVLRRWSRRLWVRMTEIAILALVAAVLGTWAGRFVPEDIANLVEPSSVLRILEILASSMLAVTTFSLSVMVMARQWTSSQSTPRAHRLVQEDTVTRNALATFLGAFVFALTALILVSTGLYVGGAVVVILGFTLLVIALVVIAILRWIDHLTDLGGVSETARRIEEATQKELTARLAEPFLGAHPLTDDFRRSELRSVASTRTGYVQHIDLAGLNECAIEAGGDIAIEAQTGSFIARGQPLAFADPEIPTDQITAAFVIGADRSFDADPRFGLVLLSEVAQRALSPGVNDPGTAIDCIGRQLRLLLSAAEDERGDPEVRHDRIFVAPLSMNDLVRDAYAGIARDGAGTVEVQVTLQKALARLADSTDPSMREAARTASGHALRHAEQAMALKEDLDRVRAAAPR